MATMTMTNIINKVLPALTEKQLKWAVEELNLRPSAYERLFSILVKREPVSAVAQREGQTPQATYKLIQQVTAEIERRLIETNKTVVVAFVETKTVDKIRALETL